MNEQRTLRWGIVGTGAIARTIAPRILEAEGAVLAAVAGRTGETADAFAVEHAVPCGFDSGRAMCRCEDVDAV